MDVVDALLPVVAVVVPTVVVLRDVRAYDRPPPVAGPPAGEAPVAVPDEVPVDVPDEVDAPPAESAADAAPDEPTGDADVEAASMLSGLTTLETDERSWVRRVGALLVLLVLTLATAALVGAGIYNAVSGLG